MFVVFASTFDHFPFGFTVRLRVGYYDKLYDKHVQNAGEFARSLSSRVACFVCYVYKVPCIATTSVSVSFLFLP